MVSTTTSKVLISFFFALALLSAKAQPAGGQTFRDSLARLVEASPVFSGIFTGFYLYDPERDTVIYEKDADKYYTPASNTKLFTFYTALKLLGDSLHVGRYVQQGDTTILWGAANPVLLHPDLPHDSTIYDRLRELPGALFYSDFNFEEDRFGPGWSWRDYQYYYQAERSPMPLYGNAIRFMREGAGTGFQVVPELFDDALEYDETLDNRRPRILRRENENFFTFNTAAMMGGEFEEEKPFHSSAALTAQLLEAALDRPVGVLDPTFYRLPTVHTLAIPTPDTLYRRLMKDSDNFIAEQLLLMVSDKLFGVQSTDLAIDYATYNLYREAPDELVWADGSGLSRYNLFTPRTVAHVLKLIREELPAEKIYDIFPAGGVSGTIEAWYGDEDETPYIYAKTGTLSNKHCLSGYLLTRSGKTLIFSFMHNNFINGTNEVKREMERVLAYIRDAG